MLCAEYRNAAPAPVQARRTKTISVAPFATASGRKGDKGSRDSAAMSACPGRKVYPRPANPLE